MAKKSYKQRCKSEKVHMGCMSGLIHMFDFRRSPKLISDGTIRRSSVRSDLKGSEDFHGIIFSDEDKDYGVKTIHASRPSIKALMEEEMASGTQILKETQRNIFGIRSDDLKSVNLQEGSDVDLDLATSLMELYRNHNGSRDIITSEVSDHSSSLIDKEHNTDASTHPKQISCSIEKALEAVAEAVITHQSANGKYTSSSYEARPNEFLDALQLLSANEEFFLMLLKDPSSRMLQCLQNLYTALGNPMLELAEDDKQTKSKVTINSLEQSEVSKYSVQKTHNFFLKEDKLVMRRPPKLNDSPRGVSRIVILKPSPGRSQTSLISSSAMSSPVQTRADLQGQEQSDKYARHFSLRELKRRLRLAISNNRKDVMSSTFQKDDSTQQFILESMSTSMDSSECEKAEKPSIVDKKTIPEDSGSGMGNDATHCASSFFYEKAKKHLIERLDNQKNDTSQIVHKSEPFGKLLSYSENDTFSQTDCPQEDVKLSEDSTASSALLTTEQEDISSNSDPPMKFGELIPLDTSTSANTQLDEFKTDHASHPVKEGTISQELTSEGIDSMNDATDTPQVSIQIETSTESLEQINTDQCFAEESQTMNALPEVSLHTPEKVNEQFNHSPSAVVGLTKPSILTFSCSPENADDKEERLSPQSVLDSFLGDGISPSHKTRTQDELSMPSTRILFKEDDTPSGTPTLQNTPQEAILDDKQARLSFIKVVLEASDFLSEESSEIWYVDGSLLDTSVLAEVGTLYCLTDDAVFLFDCVEEALCKIRDNFFGCDPWVAYLKHSVRPAPVGTGLIQEVDNCIDSLVSDEVPSTLDRVVLKDLESGSWMDLRVDTEEVAIEVWDTLLDDLLEEMVFDLWL
ncbi:hypothetical protein OsJ_15758 [Oryza sativa Japonica Group]|nr:hypothetical protein OsJ_15758 [Oryza sativa Japonica Group]CAE03490.2 OSJNBa0065O17.15 [Oryza sativa Japonica Group]